MIFYTYRMFEFLCLSFFFFRILIKCSINQFIYVNDNYFHAATIAVIYVTILLAWILSARSKTFYLRVTIDYRDSTRLRLRLWIDHSFWSRLSIPIFCFFLSDKTISTRNKRFTLVHSRNSRLCIFSDIYENYSQMLFTIR